MRCFVALQLPETLIDTIDAVQSGLSVGRPVPIENLHLTLAFLGDRTHRELAEIDTALSGLISPPVTIDLRGLDVIGGRAARLVCLRAMPDPGLVALQAKVMAALRQCGVALPRSRFRPHVTLARFGARGLGPESAARLGRFLEAEGAAVLPPVPADSFALMVSTLHSDGAIYDVLASYDLPAGTLPPLASRVDAT